MAIVTEGEQTCLVPRATWFMSYHLLPFAWLISQRF